MNCKGLCKIMQKILKWMTNAENGIKNYKPNKIIINFSWNNLRARKRSLIQFYKHSIVKTISVKLHLRIKMSRNLKRKIEN